MAGIRLGGVGAGAAREGLAFRRIKSGADLDQVLQEAAGSGRWVMLDFYADWCVACKEMERQTFTDSAVRAALQPAVLVQADVTANDEEDQALMKRFTLVGPPAILFFPPGAAEMVSQRVVGLQDAPTFLAGLRQLPGLIKSGS
jgi:thiol:disulfide interchange protein DsbD